MFDARVRIHALVLLQVLLATTGCTDSRLSKRLASSYQSQTGELEALGRDILNPTQTPLSWASAFERMESDSTALRQSRKQVEESKRQKTRQWLSLVPTVSAFVGLGNSISELTSLQGDDINARLVANFSIPNPFEFYASLYASALQEQNAVWAHELDQRRAYVQLYSFFLDSESIKKSETELRVREAQLTSIDITMLEKSLRGITFERESINRRRSYLRVGINRLLNTPGKNWDLVGPLPKISRPQRSREISVGENFGKLALNLQTIQIEGAVLNVSRTRFRQFPRINFGLSSPALYSSNDSTTGFSSDELLFFSGASKSFDASDLLGGYNVRDAKERLQFTREQLRQRMEFEITQILQTQNLYQRLAEEEEQSNRKIGRIESARSTDPTSVVADLEALRQSQTRIAEVKKQRQQLDLQFLIWDENFWKR